MAVATNEVMQARAMVGVAARRNRPPGELVAAQERLAEAKLARHIREAIAAAPPLTTESRERLAMLLLRGEA